MARIEARPPRNPPQTKARIIAAAQAEFSQRGYTQSSIRDIGLSAGVAHSLIVRYYGSKAGLFGEALRCSLDESPMRAWPKAEFGARVASAVIDPDAKIISPGMVALAIGDDEAREVAAKILSEQTMGVIAAWLGGQQAEARATRIMILTIGYAIFCRHLNVHVTPSSREGAKSWVAGLLQELVDGESDQAASARMEGVITPSTQISRAASLKSGE